MKERISRLEREISLIRNASTNNHKIWYLNECLVSLKKANYWCTILSNLQSDSLSDAIKEIDPFNVKILREISYIRDCLYKYHDEVLMQPEDTNKDCYVILNIHRCISESHFFLQGYYGML